MKKLKSLELLLLDDEANAIEINIPVDSIYGFGISKITQEISYVKDGTNNVEKYYSLGQLNLTIYKGSVANEEELFNNTFITTLKIYYEDSTEELYDLPYISDTNDESNECQRIREYKSELSKPLIEISIDEMGA